jgi:hypothetical protein
MKILNILFTPLALMLLFIAPAAELGAHNFCPALPPPSGTTVNVDTVQELVDAVNNATSGVTILVANGTYNLNGAYLRIDTPNVTLRGASGNRDAVVLDGNYQTTEIIQVVSSNVTVADLTLREAYDHPIHVMSSSTAHTTGTLIYNVHIIDPGQQAIKINPVDSTHFTDDGEIACSNIELTSQGREQIRDNCYTGGVDAHQSRGWVVKDNLISGFWCSAGLSEHAVHFWRGSRDTTIERNRLFNNARGVGLGLATSGPGRTYGDNPCPAAGGSYVDHYGGVIRNNFVWAADAALFDSQSGFDCGICLWNACNADATHNTVFSTQAPFSSIEWRFANTSAVIKNNLTSHTMRERDGATGALSGNINGAQASWFVNALEGNLHLVSGANLAIDQATYLPGFPGDIDGDARPVGAAPDVGADEYFPAPPPSLFLPLVFRH